MSKKNAIIKGALILTAAGLLSRVVGFFYRIFLSGSIGAEGMGIFQLIAPVYALCISVSCSGIQTAVSRFVAEASSKKAAIKILVSGLIMALSISAVISLLIHQNASFIAENILHESRCSILLKYISYAIPLDVIHSCVVGYFIGLKRTAIPAAMQLVEQITKFLSVYIIVTVAVTNNITITPMVAVIGMLISEAVASVFSIVVIIIEKNSLDNNFYKTEKLSFYAKLIFSVAYILTINRVLITLLQSFEAILIPYTLRMFGNSNSEALSTYGILTGMSMPLILFPLAIVNAVSAMLLPTIAEAKHKNHSGTMEYVTVKSIKFCIFSGVLCTFIFLISGKYMGTLLFDSTEAGIYIVILAWLCPFLYLSMTFGSILHGLGKTSAAFIHNIINISIRVLFVIITVPNIGIKGYLWGILASQLVTTFLHGYSVNKEIHYMEHIFKDS